MYNNMEKSAANSVFSDSSRSTNACLNHHEEQQSRPATLRGILSRRSTADTSGLISLDPPGHSQSAGFDGIPPFSNPYFDPAARVSENPLGYPPNIARDTLKELLRAWMKETPDGRSIVSQARGPGAVHGQVILSCVSAVTTTAILLESSSASPLQKIQKSPRRRLLRSHQCEVCPKGGVLICRRPLPPPAN
jgi:hypothetical protein